MKSEISIELLVSYIVSIFEYQDFKDRQNAISNLLDICYTESEKIKPRISIAHLLYATRDFVKKDKNGFTCYNTDAMKDLVLVLFRHEANDCKAITDSHTYYDIINTVMQKIFLTELNIYFTTEDNNNNNNNNKTIAECYKILNTEANYYTNEAIKKQNTVNLKH